MSSRGPGRRRWVDVAIRLAPALAGLAVTLLTAAWTFEVAVAPGTAWLGLSSAAALAPLLLIVRRERLPLALLALLLPAVAIYLPRLGAVALAAIAALLAAAITLVAVERTADGERRSALTWLALALSAQIALSFGRIWSEPLGLGMLAQLVGAPALAALLVASLDRSDGRLALAVAAAFVAAGPGFAPASLAALALAALLARARPAAAGWAPLVVALPAFGHEPAWAATALGGVAAAAALGATAVARAGRAILGFVALGALVAAAPPWLRPQPVATLLTALATPPSRPLDEPIALGSVLLSSESPRADRPLSGAPVGALVIDSAIAEGARLACGRTVFTVRLTAPERAPIEAAVAVGAGTGEWASARPDVAAKLGCDALEPHSHWLPAAERFLGRSFRARIAVDPPFPAERIEFERAADLSPAVRVYLQRVASER